VFSKMLKQGHPPDDWELLVKEAKAQSNRLSQLKSSTHP
jgi:toxin YhaV